MTSYTYVCMRSAVNGRNGGSPCQVKWFDYMISGNHVYVHASWANKMNRKENSKLQKFVIVWGEWVSLSRPPVFKQSIVPMCQNLHIKSTNMWEDNSQTEGAYLVIVNLCHIVRIFQVFIITGLIAGQHCHTICVLGWSGWRLIVVNSRAHKLSGMSYNRGGVPTDASPLKALQTKVIERIDLDQHVRTHSHHDRCSPFSHLGRQTALRKWQWGAEQLQWKEYLLLLDCA